MGGDTIAQLQELKKKLVGTPLSKQEIESIGEITSTSEEEHNCALCNEHRISFRFQDGTFVTFAMKS
jgi:hypothetical protein